MSKADYIKNTRLPGVPPEVLDVRPLSSQNTRSDVLQCFYDNTTFTHFIFIEDPLDVNGQRGLVTDGGPNRTRSSVSNPLSTSGSGSGTTLLGKANKIDPYYLIANVRVFHRCMPSCILSVCPESTWTITRRC
jgi:hypothetical protein